MLRIALSVKALLNVEDECQIFRQQGKLAFDQHMTQHVDKPLELGPMAPLVRALSATGLVEFSLFSKFSSASGERVRRSLKHHGLNVPRQHYADGPDAYLQIFNKQFHAYFSCDDQDVQNAMNMGIPAACLLPESTKMVEPIIDIRIALDWDGFFASDDSEKITVRQGLQAFIEHERINKDVPMMPGPFTAFCIALCGLRKELLMKNSDIKLTLAIVTARGDEQSLRVQTTLKHWNVEVDQIYSLEGKPKAEAVKQFGAHFFCDDSRKHCDAVSKVALSAHAIGGISNVTYVPVRKTLLNAAPTVKRQKMEEVEIISSNDLTAAPF